MAISHIAATAAGADLTTLSLDAAFQLDLVERNQSADLGVLERLVDRLELQSDASSDSNPLSLQGRPLDVDIFNSAIHRVETAPLSLHETLLSENFPFNHQDEWVLMRDERLA